MSKTLKSSTILLNNGLSMPALGFGTHVKMEEDLKTALGAAIEAGYRQIDCAMIYESETVVGDALQQNFKNKGIKREDLFITSKLWNTKHAAKDVRPALLETLKELQLDYLDLYLIHWPFGFQAGDNLFPRDELGNWLFSDVHFTETWMEMEKAVDDGLVKSIGLANFNSKQIDEVCAMSRIKPAVLQCESHPYLIQKELTAHCKKHGIVFTAYSPLGSPTRPTAKEGEAKLLEDPKLISIAAKYKKSPAQICIRYQIQRGVSTIPRSASPNRIRENADIFDFELSQEDIQIVESLNKNWRAFPFEMIKTTMVDGKLVKEEFDHHLLPFKIPY